MLPHEVEESTEAGGKQVEILHSMPRTWLLSGAEVQVQRRFSEKQGKKFLCPLPANELHQPGNPYTPSFTLQNRYIAFF